jgi:glycolate oxidase FAD binding subunit
VTATKDLLRAPELAQFGYSRAAAAGDVIDGTTPALVIEPASAEQAAAALAWASRERLTTVLRGGGTKMGWGRSPAPIDVVLSTARLNGLVAHRHGDLTATVQAGATLEDLNRQLAAQGQWLPVDTAFSGSTIGGAVATNDSGPLRHRYGTPRDLVIGITLALTDGRLVKSGGHVVKNVAGYDLGKLVSGSFGTLALIADVTLKLLPLPATSQTLLVRYPDADRLSRGVAMLSTGQLEPMSFDLRVRVSADRQEPVRQLLVRFATSPRATEAQAQEARTLLNADTELLAGTPEADLWESQVRRPWADTGTVVRLSWLPAALPRVLTLLEELARSCGGTIELTARAAVGAGHLRIDANDTAAKAAIDLLRSRAELVSNVVVLTQSTSLKGSVDAFGPAGGLATILRSVKQTFDPAGILNAGRGPV